jgi:hypothetical protein
MTKVAWVGVFACIQWSAKPLCFFCVRCVHSAFLVCLLLLDITQKSAQFFHVQRFFMCKYFSLLDRNGPCEGVTTKVGWRIVQHPIGGLGMYLCFGWLIRQQFGRNCSSIVAGCCWCAGGAVVWESRASCMPRNHPCLSTTVMDMTSSRPRRMKWWSFYKSPLVPLRNSSWMAASNSAACCRVRPCLSTAWRTLFQCIHIPWVSSNSWVTKPDVHLSTVCFECCSW